MKKKKKMIFNKLHLYIIDSVYYTRNNTFMGFSIHIMFIQLYLKLQHSRKMYPNLLFFM